MLIVKDLNRLPEYGFEKQKCKDNAGRDMYIKDVYCGGEKEEILFSIIVNPFRMSSEPDVENEAICNVYSEVDNGFEHTFPMDLVFDMVIDGVAEWVSKENYRRDKVA